MDSPAMCPKCGGNRSDYPDTERDCPECDGKGTIPPSPERPEPLPKGLRLVVLAALGWLEKQKAEAEADAARLRELLARAEPWVGLSVEAVEDDPKTGEGYQTEEYALVDKLRDEIAAALKGGE